MNVGISLAGGDQQDFTSVKDAVEWLSAIESEPAVLAVAEFLQEEGWNTDPAQEDTRATIKRALEIARENGW